MPRASAIMSASPLESICSACLGSVMSPTATVLTPVRSRMVRAKGTWYPGLSGIFCCGEVPPEDAVTQSAPRAFSSLPSATVCSISQPPAIQSEADTRTPTGRLAGKALTDRIRAEDVTALERLKKKMTVTESTPAELAAWSKIFAEARARMAKGTYFFEVVKQIEESVR